MSEELATHRNAIVNMCFLVICVLLSQVTLLVNILYCGDGYEVSIKGIVTTEKYPGGEEVTFKMEIPKFEARYCQPKQEWRDICVIVPHLGDAEYIYKLLLLLNFILVCYLWLNIYFTAFSERMPKFFSLNYMHFMYPLTYILGSILYFTVSESFTMEEGFTFAIGFYILLSVFVIAMLSAIFNKVKLNSFRDKEKTEALLEE